MHSLTRALTGTAIAAAAVAAGTASATTPAPTTLSISASASTITVGQHAQISGTLLSGTRHSPAGLSCSTGSSAPSWFP